MQNVIHKQVSTFQVFTSCIMVDHLLSITNCDQYSHLQAVIVSKKRRNNHKIIFFILIYLQITYCNSKCIKKKYVLMVYFCYNVYAFSIY